MAGSQPPSLGRIHANIDAVARPSAYPVRAALAITWSRLARLARPPVGRTPSSARRAPQRRSPTDRGRSRLLRPTEDPLIISRRRGQRLCLGTLLDLDEG